MRNYIISSEQAKQQNLLPQTLQDKLDLQGGFLSTAADDEHIVGMGIFSNAASADTVNLEYLEVDEKFRNRGVSDMIIWYTCCFLRDNGVSRISASFKGTADVLNERQQFLESKGFELVMPYVPVIGYRLGDMVQNRKFAPIMVNMPSTVCTADRISEQLLRVYSNKLAETGVRFFDMDYDPKLSAFYTAGGNIEGSMLVKLVSDMDAEMIFLYSSERADVIAVPGMLAECIGLLTKEVSPELIFTMILPSVSVYESLKKVFGEPKHDEFMQSYELLTSFYSKEEP